MATLKRMGWILIGCLIGAVVTTSIQARVQLPEPHQTRLVQVTGNVVAGRTAFIIKDTQSGGCWLALSASDGLALAQAPATACYQ